MKRYIILIIFIIFIFVADKSFATSTEEAESLLRKAQIAMIPDEAYEYANKARIIYEKEFEKNPIDINVLVGLSKVNQFIQDRAQAKLYILKAYNLNPADSKLQEEMGNFYFAFQEYSTAIEYYKLALSSGLLLDFDINLQTAICYEKLGDLKNAKLYYQICHHLNPNSREVMNKINEYESKEHPDNSWELENAKYKYLFKSKKKSEQEMIEEETDSIIENINSFY